GGGAGGAGFAGGGAGTVGGFFGLLQQTQQIRNTEASLNAQLRTLLLLEANLDAGLIDIAQVDQFRQNIETERANLLQDRNRLLASIDSFNRGTLGLPPDLPIQPDDALIKPFQLIDPAMTAMQESVADFLDRFGELPESPSVEQLQEALNDAQGLRQAIEKLFALLPSDLEKFDAQLDRRTRDMTPVEKRLHARERKALDSALEDLKARQVSSGETLESIRSDLSEQNVPQSADAIVALITELQNLVGELSLVQARARLEAITVERIVLDAKEAVEIARTNRLDWMNNRAALVDSWRLIEFNANALESSLSLRLSGSMDTIGNNRPFAFRGKNSSLRAGLEWDGPFTRLVERNSFRQQLIEYQQDRRQLIQFEDGVLQGMRGLLRSIEELRVNLEIQRRAVSIAIRRVDQTRAALNRPVPPTAPGQAPQALGPTAAQNLLFALSDLRSTQNNLMSVWLNYLAARMRLYRELGVMRLDGRGMWIDEPFRQKPKVVIAEAGGTIPPPVKQEWVDLANTEVAEVEASGSNTESRTNGGETHGRDS
ncbi:MAG: hypothetical protein AAF517_21810, partial [Planctomycetota bacterium]